jgi:hypothetical protein
MGVQGAVSLGWERSPTHPDLSSTQFKIGNQASTNDDTWLHTKEGCIEPNPDRAISEERRQSKSSPVCLLTSALLLLPYSP